MSERTERSKRVEENEHGLLPCPFCGSEIVYTETVEYDVANGPNRYRSRCAECGVMASAYLSHGESAEKWNRRTPPTSEGGEARLDVRVGEGGDVVGSVHNSVDDALGALGETLNENRGTPIYANLRYDGRDPSSSEGGGGEPDDDPRVEVLAKALCKARFRDHGGWESFEHSASDLLDKLDAARRTPAPSEERVIQETSRGYLMSTDAHFQQMYRTANEDARRRIEYTLGLVRSRLAAPAHDSEETTEDG